VVVNSREIKLTADWLSDCGWCYKMLLLLLLLVLDE